MMTKAIMVLWLMPIVFLISASGQQAAEDWFNKGNALKALGRTTEAEAAFAKAKELGYTG